MQYTVNDPLFYFISTVLYNLLISVVRKNDHLNTVHSTTERGFCRILFTDDLLTFRFFTPVNFLIK